MNLFFYPRFILEIVHGIFSMKKIKIGGRIMKKYRKNDVVSFYEEAFCEIYSTNTLVNMTKSTCQEHEFRGEYYGLKNHSAEQLSAERNDYINMLTLISDKLSNIIRLNLCLEKALSLHQNSDNSGR